MKRQLHIILFMVILSVTGLIALQGYWLNNSYTVTKNQLIKNLDMALEQSVSLYMSTFFNDSTLIIDYIDNGAIIQLHDSLSNQTANLDSMLRLIQQNNTTPTSSTFSFSFTAKNDNDTLLFSNQLPENIIFNMKDFVSTLINKELQDKTFINLSQLDTLINNELAARKIVSSFYTEVRSRSNDSLLIATWNTPHDTLHALASRYIPSSISGNQQIRIFIPHQRQFIFTQMTFSLVISTVFLLIILSCFTFIIKTLYKQKRLSELKNDFINNMTHELKTPIATVSAAVESMQNFGVLHNREKTQRYLSVSSRELNRLSGLVEKVLNMAGNEHSKPGLNQEYVNIEEIIHNIFNSQQIRKDDKQVQFSFDSPDNTLTIRADRLHLANVLHNLIENAVKYSESEVKITVSVYTKSPFTVITISDNGPGIARRHLPYLFDKFYRIPTGNIHNIKGFGLGLYYVKSIIEQHKGTIEVFSILHRGTTFTINLPL